MCAKLVDAYDRTDADDEVRVIVSTGAGRAFRAGADLGNCGATFSNSEGPRTRTTAVASRCGCSRPPSR
jgi:enoyl-CoA hydratase/carnithine racemase